LGEERAEASDVISLGFKVVGIAVALIEVDSSMAGSGTASGFVVNLSMLSFP